MPESGSSTPLLRPRGQFGVRGVDVVRTSLQARYDSPSLYRVKWEYVDNHLGPPLFLTGPINPKATER